MLTYVLHCPLFLECLEQKYEANYLSKKMPAIRKSLNQKCRDLQKKNKENVVKKEKICSTDDDYEVVEEVVKVAAKKKRIYSSDEDDDC